MANVNKQREFAVEEWKPFNAAEISALIKQGLAVQVCNSYGQIFLVDAETEDNHESDDWKCYQSINSDVQGYEPKVQAFDHDGFYYGDWLYADKTNQEKLKAVQMLESVFVIQSRKVLLELGFNHAGKTMDSFVLPFEPHEVESFSIKSEEKADQHFSGTIECVTDLGTAMKIIRQQHENSADEFFTIKDY